MNQEILTKAIEKAIAGGWHGDKDYYFAGNRIYFSFSEITEQAFSYPELIFNHDFAKALWGEDILPFNYEENEYSLHAGGTIYYPYDEGGFIEYRVKSYLYHLQMMVISDDPIAYLGDNI